MIEWNKIVKGLPETVKNLYHEMSKEEKYEFLKSAISPFDDYDKSIKNLCKFLVY